MNEVETKEICRRIKEARVAAGFSQEEMADLLELHPRGYQRYEQEAVPFKYLMRIAQLTAVSERWLLRGEVDEAELLRELVQGTQELQRGVRSGLKHQQAMLERLTRIEAALLSHEDRYRETRTPRDEDGNSRVREALGDGLS